MIPIRSSGRTFSVREAAAFLGVRTEEIYRLLKSGKIKGHRMGGVGFGRPSAEWVIPESSITEWAKNGSRRKKSGI
jgi:excisionase family DNA binding protein